MIPRGPRRVHRAAMWKFARRTPAPFARCLKVIGIATLACGACTAPARLACTPETGSQVSLFTLYLGKAIPGRPDLTDREWQLFLDQTVTPSLPDGYTVLDANGAWRDPRTHRTAGEATKVLIAALPDNPASLAAINRVRSSYQTQYHQQLVGMTVEPVCAAF